MPRYIDADILKKHGWVLAKIKTDKNGVITKIMSMQIDDAPTADVVDVVRCKDCKYFLDEDEFDSLGMCLCERIARNYGGEIYPERIHFCSYGERKE